MSAKRKICVVTGSRADYDLLHPLMLEIGADQDLQLQVIATGMHLSPEFGLTWRQIESDGIRIDAQVEMQLSSDTPVGIGKSIGLGVIGFADALSRLAPDILLVLGDRFEILAAAQAALVARIPIAHIHGGETTEGAFDEAIRHALTKMAQWHFVVVEAYRKRVVQLGEAPDRVFAHGAPGLDNLAKLDWMERAALAENLGIALGSPLFLVTYHPATRGDRKPVVALEALLAALDQFRDATVIITHPNADNDGRELIGRLEQWVAANASRARSFVSLGRRRYLSLMRECDIVLGNSSSGLTEAPALGKATVNIGDRQKGRLKAASIVDADEESGAIVAAIRKALAREFRAQLAATKSLYGSGQASRRIKDTLKAVTLETRKSFFDIDHAH